MSKIEFHETELLKAPSAVPREEFEKFLIALTHEIRNKLNTIALEAANLAEQTGALADGMRLQQQIQECSAYLKKIRETLAPDDAHTDTVMLSEFVKRLREKKRI
jgi:signal transduction histidine kinase